MTLFICEYLASKNDWRPTTITTCKRLLKLWKDWLNGRKLKRVSVSDFDEWACNNSWSDSMKYNSLWAIKGYIHWLVNNKHQWRLKKHPLLKHKVKRILPPFKYLKLSDIFKLESVCNLETPKGLQDATILWFMWETWARASEAINARVEFLDLEEHEATYIVKGGKWHTSGFGPDLKELLELWITVRNQIAKPLTRTIFINIRRGTTLTYSGVYEILNALGQKAGVEVQSHSIRRGAARQHAVDGGSTKSGIDQGGWSGTAMWRRYTRGPSLGEFKKKRWRKNGH